MMHMGCAKRPQLLMGGTCLAKEGVSAGRLQAVVGSGRAQQGPRLPAHGLQLGPVLLVAGLDLPPAPGLHLHTPGLAAADGRDAARVISADRIDT